MSEPRGLWLHEVIDIVGHRARDYMAHTLQQSGDEKVNFRLQGTWYTMGITGRWPQVINIWDVPGGWDGWLEAVDRLNLERPANKELEAWWLEALKMRSGGFDRLLASVPGCPTTEELVERGVRGTLFVHELTEVRPGAAADYLASIREEKAGVLAQHGHTLTGLYEVLLCDHEVVVTWATDPAGHVALQRARDGEDDRLLAWERTARQHTVRRREELMTPQPGIPIGPES
jgi:hypothetical protein